MNWSLTSPDPTEADLWSVSRASQLLGVDRRSLGRRLEGVAPARITGTSRLYRPRDIFAAMEQREHGDPRDVASEKARLTRAQADQAELNLAAARGELVRADEVRKTAFELARAARDALLGVPDRVAPILAGLTDEFEVNRVLKEEIVLVCRTLSRDPFAFAREKEIDSTP